MSKNLKSSLAAAVLLAVMATPAMAADPTSVTTDILLARPGGFVVTILGAGAWIATSPFTFINGTARESAEFFVQKPARYTFKRPLGEDL